MRISLGGDNLRRIGSFLWIAGWLVVVAHVCLSSRGRADLSHANLPTIETEFPNAETGNREIRIALLGDCHSFRWPLREFRDSIAADGHYDLAIQMGDFVDYDEDLAYHHFISRLGDPESFPVPLLLVRGNHEAIDFTLEASEHFLSYIPQPNRTIQLGTVLLLVLDSAHAALQIETREFARNAASSFRQKYPPEVGRIVLLTHIPPTTEGSRCTDLPRKDTQFLQEFCSEFAVAHLIAGHVHDSFESEMQDTLLIVEGSGGGSITAPSPSVHFLDCSIPADPLAPLATKTHALSREPLWISKMDYLWNITLLRFRWVTGLVAAGFLLREIIAIRSLSLAK